MLCWLLFGAVAIPAVAADWSWQILLYAVLSLTVVRMVPVAIGLLGSRVDRRSVLFIGWFGPRGLASVIFALITLEDLHDVSGPVDLVVATIGLTVLLSVFLHGLTAQPLVRWFAADRSGIEEAEASTAEVSVRHLVKPTRRAD
jgi:sodium/hydrogen antiporter